MPSGVTPCTQKLLAAVGLVLLATSATAQPSLAPVKPAEVAAKPENVKLGKKWMRVAQDEQGEPRAMQTAIVRYAPKAGQKGRPSRGRPLTVDLIGAVHVGDPAYYAELNQRFRNYDVLLYELVAPEGTVVPRGAQVSNRGALGMVQGGMGAILNLVHQVEYVDYTRPNFVHADMSPAEFFQTMQDRGESVLSTMLQMMMEGQAAGNTEEGQEKAAKQNADMIVALFSKDRPRRLKILAARQFEDSLSVLSNVGGEKGTTLIHERNKRALQVLRKQIDSGRNRIGIFYGAGHLDDMHKRLVADFGLEPKGVEWVDAWDLTAR